MAETLTLILDSPDRSAVPLNFRSMDGPFLKALAPAPTRAGLSSVRVSGSGQFSKGELRGLLKELPEAFTIVDLRQESHGFVNGDAVSFYAPRNFANAGKPLALIEALEARQLEALLRAGKAVLGNVTAKDRQGRITALVPLPVTVSSVSTEARLAKSAGLGYVRIPVMDHARPSDEDVERFLALWRELPARGWLHFHCHAGEGRTAVFMAMADMLVNAGNVGFEDILRRQFALGGLDLRSGAPGWKNAYAIERREFLGRFHAYAAMNPGAKRMTWMQWLQFGGPSRMAGEAANKTP